MSRLVGDQELEGGEGQGPLLQAQLNLEGAVCLSACLPAASGSYKLTVRRDSLPLTK